MRRSELDPRVVEAALALCGALPDPVLIGRRAARLTRSVADVRALPTGARYEAACWWCDDETDALSELRSLRGALTPGAVVVAMAEEQPAAFERLRALVGVKKRAAHERLCSALVLAGYLEPAAQTVQGVLLVRASLPARLDALDELFEQPAPT